MNTCALPRYVLPVTISVTKVSGIGEDTMFMGVLEVRGCDQWA